MATQVDKFVYNMLKLCYRLHVLVECVEVSKTLK